MTIFKGLLRLYKMSFSSMKWQMALIALLVISCASDDNPGTTEEVESRAFLMGFTAFPYDASSNAVDETIQNVVRDGDLFLNHFDFGVPWDEVRNALPFPEEVEHAIAIAKSSKSATTKILLTATPTDQTRMQLAKYWNNDGTHQPLPAFWENKTFDDPDVVTTYLQYCRRIIDAVQPDYFAYGIETNATFKRDDPSFSAFLGLAEIVYNALKQDYPDLPIFLTLQDQSFDITKSELLEISQMLLQFSDYIAISTYPFLYYQDLNRDANPDLFPNLWLSDFRELAPDKPFAISETGFAAQDLVIANLGVNVKGTEAWQAAFTEKLFALGNQFDAEFIAWFIYRDYDLLYDKTPNPPDIFKVWKDNGLLDGDGAKRPAYEIWKRWQERTVQ